jgi:hypothetical protein
MHRNTKKGVGGIDGWMDGWAGASCLDGDTRARIKMVLFFPEDIEGRRALYAFLETCAICCGDKQYIWHIFETVLSSSLYSIFCVHVRSCTSCHLSFGK